MAKLSKGPRGGRPIPLRPSEAAGEPGSPPRAGDRPRARTVARPHRPDRKGGHAGSLVPPTEPPTMEPTAPPPASEPRHFIGIDVSKAELDVSVDGAAAFTVARTDAGVADLAGRLAGL